MVCSRWLQSSWHKIVVCGVVVIGWCAVRALSPPPPPAPAPPKGDEDILLHPSVPLTGDLSRRLAARTGTVQPFIVVSTQRSGSTYFMSMLRSIQQSGGPVRTVVSEPAGQVLRDMKLSFDQVTAMKWPDFEAVLRKAMDKFACSVDDSGPGEPRTACGCKLMYNQIPGSRSEPTELSRTMFEWLVSHDVKIVHLIRRSHVRKVLSILRLSETGVAHTRKGGDPMAGFEPLDVDTHKLVSSVRESLRVAVAHREDMRAVIPPGHLHEVFYEDLLKDAMLGSTRTFARVLKFISPLQSDLSTWIDHASTDILRNPFMPCGMLVAAWPDIEPALLALRDTQLHDDPALDAEMHAELDFSLHDCKQATYATQPPTPRWHRWRAFLRGGASVVGVDV